LATLLETLSLPKDLHKLSIAELEQLAEEIRVRLLEIGDQCGGHLASNLGVVELTIVLHSLFSSPEDRMVWDTSHQTYVHKMLTGRLEKMFTIRQEGGLSGFAKIAESDHDAFGAGHASTALSAALGMAQARDIKKRDNSVISIIGDASLSGGMCFEALNNIEKLSSNFICILNDNDMSISPPVGNMAQYMTKIRTSSLYDNAKKQFETVVKKIPKFGEPLIRRLEKAAEHARDLIFDTKAGVIFEEFGFKYLGPIDGHNIPMLMIALDYAKSYDGPILVHIITQKGKGHLPAEQDPVTYHGVSPKKAPTSKPAIKPRTYTQVFGDTVCDIAAQNENVAVITPAMEGGSGLTRYAKEYPDRYFDVGIAEEHAVTFCAGLARDNVIPICAIYSTFLQRGYDQLVHDVCLQNLPVIFALDRAGLVGEDGPTHHGVLDYNYLLPIPNIQILAPKDGLELEHMLHWAVDQGKPISIRYSKGPVPEHNGLINEPIEEAKAEVLFRSTEEEYDCCIVGVGSMAWPAYDAAKVLESQGLKVAAINLRFVKPLDTKLLNEYFRKSKSILVVEEGNAIGGIFHYILHECKETVPLLNQCHQIAIPDTFVDHGKLGDLRQSLSLSANGIVERVKEITASFTSAIRAN